MAQNQPVRVVFEKGKVERILALSSELNNLSLSILIQKLSELKVERTKGDNKDTIHG
jgi:hypothetical protein